VALNALGWFHAMLGNHQEALSYAGQSLDLSREIGSEDGMAAALDSLGYAHQHLGRHAEAIQCYQQALDLHLEVSGNWGAAETLGHLGDARYAAGDVEGARADWEESLVILEDLNHPDAAQIRARLSGL
jgi:tetratricopeptide (TPR) repeat protein